MNPFGAKYLMAVISLICLTYPIQGQKKNPSNEPIYSQELFDAVKWRSIGPYRGGRSCAITGVVGKPNLFYMGVTGGGVWKTEDAGQNWENISDGFFGGSIGAVAVSPSNNNILYVGTGESTVRGNVSPGYGGLFKSYDGGKTWENIGLENGMHVGRIRVHPDNPEVVYVAVMGDLFKDSTERGVYKTTDGGKSWRKILYVSPQAGAVDLILEPGNPRIIYASTWKIRRTPYSLSSGGEGSTLWKSTDEGQTWKEISNNEGMPEEPLGIIGVAVSPVDPDIVWAQIEAEKGGLYRSEDAGKTWQLINEDRNLRQRAWYYTRIYADPVNVDRVYVLNVQFWRSNDGGNTFESIATPHGDHHDLWISPDDNKLLAVADDGGGQISKDAGESWSTYMNQPTAQFYRVTTDDHFPYRIYAAQQDNSTVRILHRSDGQAITERDWEPTAGGESAHIAVKPDNNEIVFGGSYDGFLSRKNHENNQTKIVNVWPDNPMGHGAEGMKYRFQWNFPIFFSPHNPDKLYTTSNHVHVSMDEGQSWEIISPDLTRAEPKKLVSSGGPITQDNTSVEYYATIFAACESPYEEDLLWAASDDGLVHVSKDGGKNWTNVTPKDAPKYLMYNSIAPDPFNDGGAYLAGTLYKTGDYRPYLYKTTDYGKTWKKITDGIASNHFTRVLRADPERQGLLYAGTEAGMYISFNDGTDWQPFDLNLPQVPITDLIIKNNNLVAATQGRSLWMIDDLTILHQLNEEVKSKDVHLFKPLASYRMGSPSWGDPPANAGENHHNGVGFYYFLKDSVSENDTVKIEVMGMDGALIKSFSNAAEEEKDKIKPQKGSNSFVWDMRYPDGEGFEGLIMWAANLKGPKAVPGQYKARLSFNGKVSETVFEIKKDPRSTSSISDLQEQFDFIAEIKDKLSETHQTIKQIRDAREQMNNFKERLKGQEDYKELIAEIDSVDKKMTRIEETLYQTKNESRQDPLNFPIRLNNKLAHVKNMSEIGDFKPTDQARAVKDALTKQIDEALTRWGKVKSVEIPRINQKVKEKQVDAIILKEEEPTF